MQPTKLSQITSYQSPWLKAEDLQGRAVAVTIDRVAVEDIRQRDGSREPRVVVAFRGKGKRLICNKTQAMTLADLAKTEEFGRWPGLTVTLAPGRTPSGQATVLIRPAAAAQATQAFVALTGRQPSPMAGDDDDNPFEESEQSR